MMIRKLLICFSIFIISQFAYCQNDDFGIWYGLNAEYSINKKWEVDLSPMVRTFMNASTIEQAFLEGGVTYKFNKHFSAALAYRLTENRESNSEYHIRHKYFADLKGSEDLWLFSFTGRFRFQRQDKTFFDSKNDKIPDYYGRFKIKSKFRTPSFPVNPYVYIETFCRMFEETKKRFDKNRFSIGFEYKISKKQSAEAEYIFERDFLPHLLDTNIVSLNYNINF